MLGHAAALALAACCCWSPGAAARAPPRPPLGRRAKHAPSAGARGRRGPSGVLVYHHLYSLPAPLRDPAIAALAGGRGSCSLAGLTPRTPRPPRSTIADLHHVVAPGTLPGAQHDAQGAGLAAGRVRVRRRQRLAEFDHILRFDPATATVTHGRARCRRCPPTSRSPRSARTAYVVGGYDGTNWLNTVSPARPGGGARVVGHLPVGLRYAAVTPGPIGQILIIGGSTPSGGASGAIYSFDPATGPPRVLGQAAPADHPRRGGDARLLPSTWSAAAATSTTGQTAAIWSINPATGAIRARRAPARADVGRRRAAVGGAIVVAGGHDARGRHRWPGSASSSRRPSRSRGQRSAALDGGDVVDDRAPAGRG